jgi:hypothetical protein
VKNQTVDFDALKAYLTVRVLKAYMRVVRNAEGITFADFGSYEELTEAERGLIKQVDAEVMAEPRYLSVEFGNPEK